MISHFYFRLTFAVKDRSLPSEYFKRFHWGRLQSCLKMLRLRCKRIAVTNALALVLVTSVKSFLLQAKAADRIYICSLLWV
jgi:hypothetical protein